jgi:hypothetical protein
MIRTRALFAICAAIAMVSLTGGQGQEPQPEQPPSTPTFRTRGEGVRIDVLVTDREKPVAGLTTKDFALTDNGVGQVVEAASLAEMPLDVILVLDLSVSLREEGIARRSSRFRRW